MALTQMQQIQSLGEALAWLEREIGWGVQPAALTGNPRVRSGCFPPRFPLPFPIVS